MVTNKHTANTKTIPINLFLGCRENKSTNSNQLKFQSTKTIPINLFLGCRENKSKRAEENKSMQDLKKFFPHSIKKKKNASELVGTWWFLVADQYCLVFW